MKTKGFKSLGPWQKKKSIFKLESVVNFLYSCYLCNLASRNVDAAIHYTQLETVATALSCLLDDPSERLCLTCLLCPCQKEAATLTAFRPL